jgi:hypothetical protein
VDNQRAFDLCFSHSFDHRALIVAEGRLESQINENGFSGREEENPEN